MLAPLQTLINQLQGDSDALQHLLASFRCERDSDIEYFLQEKSVMFESLSKSRTYLVCDEDAMLEQGKIIILGYFSLALKVLHIPDAISIRNRKELDGYRGKIHNEPITELPCYLIGQLSRNDGVEKDVLSGDALIEEALRVIANSLDAVGGRILMIECRPEQKLIDFYTRNDFHEIARIADNDKPMVQMIRMLV